MEIFRTRATVSKDGKLSIKGLPFCPGEKVEVLVRAEEPTPVIERRALVSELKAVFREMQALPQAKTITEDEIAAEIAAYRAEQLK